MAVRIDIIKRLLEPPAHHVDESEDWQSPTGSVADLPFEWRVEFEERAAILEYDGGLAREEAERRAFAEVLRRIRASGDTAV